jgi:hypothetical protein
MPATRCPLPHYKDPDRPRAVGDGVNICAGHYASLERYIDEAPVLDADLLRAYTAGAATGEKVHSSKTPGLNVRDDIIEARTWLHQVYRAWSRHVVAELQLSGTSSPDTSRQQAVAGLAADASKRKLVHNNENVVTLHVRHIHSGRDLDADLNQLLETGDLDAQARTLKTHLGWLAAGDDVEDLHNDLTATVQLGRRIVAPTGVRTLPIGQCVEDASCTVETREGVPCNGTLQVTLYPEDPSLPSPHLIVCTDCGAHYLPAKWLKLGERVHARQAANA